MEKSIKCLKEEVSRLRGYAVIIDGEDGDWEPVTTVSMEDIYELIDQLEELGVEQLERKIKELESFNDELIRDNNQFRNELDNQEALSEEWIDEHKHYYPVTAFNNSAKEIVDVEDLQNLLVPKQEEVDRAYKDGYEKGKEHATKVIKPTIPKFIAEVIEEDKERGYDVYDSIDLIIETDGGGLLSISDWVARNIDKYARAWLYGYTVEEKLKYFAKIKGHENIGADDKYWN